MAPSFLRLALAGVLIVASVPAVAQLKGSPGYEFLNAVREDKGADVDKILAKPGSRIIDTQDVTTGETALHIVAKRNDSRYISYLLAKGANPNIKDNAGNTPLIVAVDRGFAGLIPILLKGKANPNFVGEGGQTPLIKAVLRRDEEMVRTLLDGGADPDRKDYLAGKSARDYANEDARSATLAKLFKDVPVKTRRAVSGPTL
ncbi:MAG: ankyrin repeat domain-containing protein [Sphingomonas sp.]|uniref:ankyrin repeat domain-containing protein n=1 Tax=Sphingomonas sp. TaxID=28214 RepID=UPI001ACC8231|nr:ankyrin repeat domain-containing protein [Sphingomonas sp.]MBN8815616.1 ankyrin repeat domain-containing protein [Sphingomonas sp.]